jgi:hypothetical protein
MHQVVLATQSTTACIAAAALHVVGPLQYIQAAPCMHAQTAPTSIAVKGRVLVLCPSEHTKLGKAFMQQRTQREHSCTQSASTQADPARSSTAEAKSNLSCRPLLCTHICTNKYAHNCSVAAVSHAIRSNPAPQKQQPEEPPYTPHQASISE